MGLHGRDDAFLLHASPLDATAMNQKSAVDTVESAASVESPVQRPLDIRALSAALAGICTDSRRESETYLRDTVVPHGGE